MPDLRLVGPAIAVWAGAFLALSAPAWALLLIPALAAAAAYTRPSARSAAVAALLCLAAGALSAAGREAAAGMGPLPELAAERAVVTVRLVVTDDPRIVTPRVRGPRRGPTLILVKARAEQVTARGGRTRVRTPVLVLSADPRWRSVVPGQRLQATGRLAPPRAGDSTVAVLQGAAAPEDVAGPPAMQRIADRLRDGLRDAVAGLPPEARGLVPGLVVGDTSRMPPELVEEFRTAGLSHLVAVSGANVAIVLGAVLIACRWLGVRRRASLLLGALAMGGFVVLARPDPSVLRATAMGLVAVAALASGRPRRGLPTLCAVVVLLILADPWLARSYGFVLSVLATAGLLVLAPPWRAAFAHRMPGPVADALAVPMAAQVACAPVVAMLSAQVSLVAVPANLLAAPAVPPATVLGVLAAVTAPVAPPVAHVLGELAGLPAGWIVAVAHRSAAVPGAAIAWPGGTAGGLALAALTLVAALCWPLRRRVSWLPHTLALLLVVVALRPALPPWWSGWPPPGWLLVACDVGQGDALVLAAGPGSAVVVDAGPDPKTVDGCLRRLGVRQVPYLLLSHFHADHVEGVPGVLRGRQVAEIGVSPLADPDDGAERVRRWAAADKVPVTEPVVGEVRAAGPLRWRVIWPRRLIQGEGSAPNNASVVVLAERDGVGVLLTGDIEPAAQRAVLAAEPGLRAEVLKVPHHGSAHQEPELLTATGARVAVISSGEGNDYGHPGPSTVTALKAAGVRLLRTDELGDVAVLGPAGRLRVASRGRRPRLRKRARTGNAAETPTPYGGQMADLFQDYPLGPAWDEMFVDQGVPRGSYEAVYDAVRPLASEELRARVDNLSRAFVDRGVTFALGGEERPFPLDIIPRVITAEEWDHVSRGVAQRVRALEVFLADVYGAGEVFSDGVVPRRLVASSSHFHREAVGIEPPNGVRVHVSGIDVVRDESGTFRALEDNIRTPSGVSYVIENRRAMMGTFPEAFAGHRILPVSDFPQRLLVALRAAAPAGINDPTVVVLTPGVYNSAYFEHALLARLMGVELVEGRDLVCSGNRVRMRTTEGERRVDVIYRRIDDEFLDPVQFRADSVVGCPGLLNAARSGAVTIANAVGNGVADDKLIYSYVPDIIRYYFGEQPILENVETYRLEDADVLPWVLDHLDTLVLKPVDSSGGKGIVIGTQAGDEELARLRATVIADPRGWIAQRVVSLSTVPTLVGDRLRPRHVDLRPFAVHDGTDVWVLPGGLTRVALPEGELVVNSSQGGGSKDTWVLTDETWVAEAPVTGGADFTALQPASAPDPGPQLSQQAQQQQQQSQQQQ